MTDEPTAVNVADHDVVLRIRHTRSIAEARVLYAERIAEARREGAAEALEGAAGTDFIDGCYGGPQIAVWLRDRATASLRGDA